MLSWNEIRHRATGFSREWRDTTSEKSESQSFWNDFFHVFGIKRRTVASFEEPVKKLSGTWGKIDLFWPGKVLVEHKSAGQDLDKAHSQGMEYIRGLVDSGREKEVPRFLIVSDFKRIALHDLEPEQDSDLPLLKRLPPSIVFPLEDLHKHIRRFAFIPGYKQHKLNPEDPANIEAAELMAHLHDALEAGGFSGHDLRVLLVRLLFCLFADDTGIFNQKDFQLLIENRTAGDGSDTGPKLARLFEVLNTPENSRQANLDEDLAAFPYINGALFEERISFADFNAQMRGQLLKACAFKWERISPAVFGSLFQGVMDSKERRQIGAHYTAEKNILKLIRPLFLDELRAEFEAGKADKSTRRTARLEALHQKLSVLTFFDPACGCGNFLVVTYRELRALELEILLELHLNQFGDEQHRQTEFSSDVTKLSKIDVDQMYGIEIEEFPAKIAEVALWLADHQANIALSEAFGQLYRRIPLQKSPHIVFGQDEGNALIIDWKKLLPPEKCSYILGNPPFVGKKEQTVSQKKDIEAIWGESHGTGILDLVTCWYALAGIYVRNTKIRCAFVSTNSITQGQQVSALWANLWRMNPSLCIHFAHRTFEWESEARGKAHVHTVIIGFGSDAIALPTIFEYESLRSDPTAILASRINPYLADAPNVLLGTRRTALNAPKSISYGSMMIDKDRKADDDMGLILNELQKDQILRQCPALKPFIRLLFGGEEYIKGERRWCLWLVAVPPALVGGCNEVRRRIDGVRKFREGSPRAQTRKLALTPSLFGEIRQPSTRYLLIPKVSSETRRYIPIGFVEPEIIASGSALVVANADSWDFGILTSAIHNAWLKAVGGRMKSDPQYSNEIVYNNFPWPTDATEAQRGKVEEAAQAVLAAREQFPGSTLADLYDPVSMPPKLSKAHETLDRAVDRCYRKEPFTTDRQRVEYLFALYEQLTAPLVAVKKKAKKRKG